MSTDFALVEIQFPPLIHESENYGAWEFSAFVETPDALSGVGPTDWLPIQGVALSDSPPEDYFAVPTLAFPGVDPDGPLGTVADSNKFCSLLVDLRTLAPTGLIRIGLYGQIVGYNLVGGTGIDDGQAGTLFSTQFYGSLTKDYRPFADTAWTPGGLAAADDNLFIVASLGADAYDVMVTSFPELAGVSHELLGEGIGDRQVGTAFHAAGAFSPTTWINDDFTTSWGTTLGAEPSSAVPDDNPNSWGLFAFNLEWDGTDESITTTVNWQAGIPKTKTINCSLMLYSHGGDVDLVNSVPSEIDAGSTATVGSIYQIQYFVPSWNYPVARSGSVKALGLTGVNLWTGYAQRDSAFDPGSRSWEDPGIYPDRVELADLGTVSMQSGPSTGDYYPANHFGHRRLGTITILRSTGAITFEPELTPPTDGTPDGDGAVGDGSAPGRTDNPHLRAWTFSLDGHDYYVLRLGDSLTLVYDVYSEQWMDWTDFDSLTWRAHCGRNWVGAEALGDTYGSNVIVGDDAYGLLWLLDPNQPFDDDPLVGAVTPSYFARVTVGQVPMKGREVLPCYATWLTTDMGDPAYSGAAVTLWMSDDAGVTWESQGYVRVTADENRPELAWYSLGQIAAPGRLFKIFDDGAITRIDGLEMNDPDDEK